MTKEVYNPKEHAKNDKKLGSKATKAKAKAKPEKKRTPKINKHGFLYVDKDLAKHLGIELGKDKTDIPVSVEPIENGFVVKIVKV